MKLKIQPLRGRVFKIQSNHDRVRTDIIQGLTMALPRPGFRFGMTGSPVDPNANCRVFFTTEVKEIAQLSSGEILFRTRNSTYCYLPLPPLDLPEPDPSEEKKPDPPRGVGLESDCPKARPRDKGKHAWHVAMGDPTSCMNCHQWWDGIYPELERPKTDP